MMDGDDDDSYCKDRNYNYDEFYHIDASKI